MVQQTKWLRGYYGLVNMAQVERICWITASNKKDYLGYKPAGDPKADFVHVFPLTEGKSQTEFKQLVDAIQEFIGDSNKVLDLNTVRLRY